MDRAYYGGTGTMNAPDIIYLQTGPDATWCEDRICDDDVEYRRVGTTATGDEPRNEYTPWVTEGVSETEYWKQRYLEARMEAGDVEREALIDRFAHATIRCAGIVTERGVPNDALLDERTRSRQALSDALAAAPTEAEPRAWELWSDSPRHGGDERAPWPIRVTALKHVADSWPRGLKMRIGDGDEWERKWVVPLFAAPSTEDET